MSKTRPVSRTRRLRPAAARSGVSRRSEVFVNRFAGALCFFSGGAEFEAQNSLRGRFEGRPHQCGASRLRPGKLGVELAEVKGVSALKSSVRRRAPREERRK